MRYTVLQTEELPPAAAAWLAERANVVHAASNTDSFRKAARDAAGLVVRTYTKVDNVLLETLPSLRVVGRAGVGLDNIDLAACRARGIRVVHTPDANTQAVVEYVLALLCDALRPRASLSCAVDTTQWNELRHRSTALRQMNEMRLGILGLGRIGRRVAAVAGAIGFRVSYADIRTVPESERAGAACVSAEELFASNDVVTLHIDGRPSNRRYVSAALLDSMPAHALLLNTCRGMVMDTAALAAALRAHPTRQAVLDVHEPEPFAADYPLLGLPNARLLPHLASRTITAVDAMSWVVKDVVAVLEGREPQWSA